MSDVKKFFTDLSDSDKDLFVSVVTDLQSSSPMEKIDRLRNFHAQLKTEIDSINRRRQALGGILNNSEVLLRKLDVHIAKNGETLDLVMFQSILQKVTADLKAEIAALKPEKKLAKKFDVARRTESLLQRQSLAGHLFDEVLNDGKFSTPPSRGFPVDSDLVEDIEEDDSE